jgi:hypothetical protein
VKYVRLYYCIGLTMFTGLLSVLITMLGSPPVSLQAQSLTLTQPLSENADPQIVASDSVTAYLPLVFRNYVTCLAPTLISPTNGSLLNTLIPELKIQSNNSVGYSTIEYSHDPTFSVVSYATPGRRLWSNLLPATVHYWRAQSVCSYPTSMSLYSNVFTFTSGSGGTLLPAPILLNPPNGAVGVDLPVALSWNAVPGAVEYQLWTHRIGDSFSFIETVTQTSRILYGWSNATIEWRVTARNDYAWGWVSSTWSFSTASFLEDRD